MQRDVQRGIARTAASAGLLLAACGWMTALAPAANAQVLEIGEGGAVTVHDRPEVTLATGATPILRAARQTQAPAGSGPQSAALNDAAARADLSPDLVEAVAWAESRLRPGVVSSAGAVGEMQLMPGAARELGVNPLDSRQNLAGGALYLGGLLKRYDGDMVRALAAYNAGPGAVDRYGGVPPYKETQAYVSAILKRLSERADAQSRR